MRSPRSLFAVLLLAIGLGLAGANLWFAAARSTIPLRLDGRIVAKELRPEKIWGVDDVCLLHLADGQILHVDQRVFEAVRRGQSIEKTAWSRELTHGGRSLGLQWSIDARGMSWAMPLAAAVCAALAILVVRRPTRRGLMTDRRAQRR